MNLTEILDSWETDSHIDPTNPGRESIKIPSLHAKYLRCLSNNKMLLKKANDEYAEMKNIKWNYYSGHYNTNKEMLEKLGLEPFKFILKQDMSIYLGSDKDLMNISKKVAYYQEIVDVCTQILLSLKNRTWELKSYIDYLKFESGG